MTPDDIMRADALSRMDSQWNWTVTNDRWLKVYGGFSNTWEWTIDLDDVRAGRVVKMPAHAERANLVRQAIAQSSRPAEGRRNGSRNGSSQEMLRRLRLPAGIVWVQKQGKD